ncbi:MAG: hypothetical protein LC730_01005, partial [Acidobacteria bacterium]|nr:hypothetical protein [Acidobacteriota bacterium]MCA1608026.1 hypothetical protein [Acidobacteriota bacterium]
IFLAARYKFFIRSIWQRFLVHLCINIFRPWILVLVALLFAAIVLYRVNQPVAIRPAEQPFKATEDTVIEKQHVIPAGEYLAVRMDFNRRINLKGKFRTPKLDEGINCLVVSEKNLELWRRGDSYERISETGYIPGGRIERVIEPGAYYLIFDNRRSARNQPIDVNFTVE